MSAFAQSNAIQLPDQQTPPHYFTIRAPAILPANVICTLGTTGFGSCSNPAPTYGTLTFSTPGIVTAAGSGAALNFVGSTTVNGNFVFSPGAVAGNSSTVFNASRLDQPAVILNNKSGTTTGNIFEIRDSSAGVVLQVIGSSDAGAPNALTLKGEVTPMSTTPTYTIGNSTHLWLKGWFANLDFSGSLTQGGTTRIDSSGNAALGTVGGSTFTASVGYYSPNAASNVLNIPNGGILALNATVGSISNYVVYAGSVPQINAGSLGGAFNIVGSTTGNGNIVFSPGAVAANSSVVVNAARLDQPALILNNLAGTTTGNIFEIRNSSSSVVLKVIGATDAGAPNALIVAGEVTQFPTTPTYSLGNSGHRWLKLWAQDGDFSGNLAANAGSLNGLSMYGNVSMFSYGGYLGSGFFRTNGTSGSPTALSSGDAMGEHFWYGYDGSLYAGGAAIRAQASQTFTGSAHGTSMSFHTTPNGANDYWFDYPPRMTISGDGNVGIGTAGPSTALDIVGVATASVGFASLNAASNVLNIPNGGILALNAVFGSISNYIVVRGTSPQLDATNLGAGFNFNGSGTVNGNIVFNPGAVAGNASVFINTPRLDWPGLILKNATGTTTGNVFEIQNSAGVAMVRVVGSGAGSGLAPSSLFVGLDSTDIGLTGPSVIAQDVIASVSATSNASIISIAATPGSGGADLSVSKSGTGTLLPLRFWRSPNELARFDTSNRFLIGLTSSDVASGIGSLIVADTLVTATATANASIGSFAAIAGTYVALGSGHTGTGTNLPLALFTSATERIRILAGGATLIGRTTDDGTGAALQLTGAFSFSSALIQGGVTRLDASGNLTVASCTGCAASGVSSLAATSPISVSASTGAVTIVCSDCGTLSTGQTYTGAKVFSNANLPIVQLLSSSSNSSLIEFKDTAGSPNRWWAGTGEASGTDGHFIIYDASRSTIRLSMPPAGATQLYGATLSNGNIVLNPGNVTGLSSVQVNGRSNSNTTTLALIVNEAGSPLGSGISIKHGGTFDAAWQAGVGAAFGVVSNDTVTSRFVILQTGQVLVARTSDNATGAILQVQGGISFTGNMTAPSGSNGISSTTLTVRNSSGAGTCTITISGGIVTASTC